MNCEEALRAVQEELDGTLAPEAAAALKAHLEGCSSCRSAQADDRRLHERLAGLLASAAPQRPPAFPGKVLEEIRREASGKKSLEEGPLVRDLRAWWERPWAFGGLALAGAAAFALFLLWKPAAKDRRPFELSQAPVQRTASAERRAQAPAAEAAQAKRLGPALPRSEKGAIARRRTLVRKTMLLAQAAPAASFATPSIPGMKPGFSGASGRRPPLPFPSAVKKKDLAWAEAVLKETSQGRRAAFAGMSGGYGSRGAASKSRSSVRAAAGGMPSGSAMLGRVVNAWMQEFSRVPGRLDLEDVFGLVRPVSMPRAEALGFIRELDGELLNGLFRRMDAPQQTRYLPEALKDREVLTAFLGKLSRENAAWLRRAVPEIADIAGAEPAPAAAPEPASWTDDDLAQARADAVEYQRTLEQDLLRPMLEHARSLMGSAGPRTGEAAEALRYVLLFSEGDVGWLRERFPQSRVLADLERIRGEFGGRDASDTLLGRLDSDAQALSEGARLLSVDDLDAWTRLGLAARAVASRELKAREAVHYDDEYRADYEADRERIATLERRMPGRGGTLLYQPGLETYRTKLQEAREKLGTSAWALWGEGGQRRARDLGQASLLTHEVLANWLERYNRNYESPEEAYRAWVLPDCLRRRFGELAAEAVLRESEAAAEFSAMGREDMTDDQRAEHYLLGVRSQIQSLWCVRGAVMILGARTCGEAETLERAQDEFTAGLAGFE